MVQYILAGMQAVSNKVVKFDKLREITQDPDENSALFLNHFTEALTTCSKLNSESPSVGTVLSNNFLSQSVPDVTKKLK